MKRNLLVKIFLTVLFVVGIVPAFAVEPSTTHSVTGALLSQGEPGSFMGVLQQAGKSQIVAAVLAWFLGVYGVHLFYLGYKKKAVNRLLMGIGGSAIMIIGAVFSALAFYVAYGGNPEGAGVFSIFAYMFYGLGGIILLIDWILTLIDFIHILQGTLKPAGGDYTETL